jgi:hypothetical protein
MTNIQAVSNSATTTANTVEWCPSNGDMKIQFPSLHFITSISFIGPNAADYSLVVKYQYADSGPELDAHEVN